jgi:hypothetical protein
MTTASAWDGATLPSRIIGRAAAETTINSKVTGAGVKPADSALHQLSEYYPSVVLTTDEPQRPEINQPGAERAGKGRAFSLLHLLC